MTFTVDFNIELITVITTVGERFDMAAEQPHIHAQVAEHLKVAGEPVFYIVDLSHTLMTLDKIVVGTNGGANSDNSPWRSPTIREMMFVSPDPVVHAAVKGMNSEVFGYFDAKCFNSLDDAFDYIRTEIQKAV